VLKDAYLPATEPNEVRALLRRLPLAVDQEGFSRFVLGFPRKYLTTTSPVEIVKHFALVESLAARSVISSISRDGPLWRMCVVARDRSFLFARIAGTLSCYGMNIVSAEAFANANSLVLDTFGFTDPEAHFDEDGQRRRFQVFLEDVVDGKVDVEAALRRHPDAARPTEGAVSVSWDDDAHPTATLMALGGRDRFGLLYRVSRCVSEGGCSIEMAYIDTVNGEVRDEFYLTRSGAKLTSDERRAIQTTIETLADVSSSTPPAA
jgi:[protein-PII] uridylyltransferase